jgi:hypothetical protein
VTEYARLHQPTPPPARFPDRVRLPFDVDPAPLVADLASLAGTIWTPHFVRQNYEGDWSALPLRCGARAVHPIHRIGCDPTETRFVDTEILAALPAFRAALARFRCPTRVVRLMRLAAGSTIREHEDPGLSAEDGLARLHIPVTTSPDVDFRVNGRPVEMAPGSVWYLRLSDPHRVVNRGRADRIHLVVDAVVDPWLEKMLGRGASAGLSPAD